MSSISYEFFTTKFGTDSPIGFTSEGGLYVQLINNTGTSVKGTIVVASATAGVNNAVDIASAGSQLPLGVIYEDGVADGDPVKVVVAGRAQVLLRNNESAVQGYWCGVSTLTAGRMVQSNLLPTLLATVMQGIGRSLETVLGGDDILAYVLLHFS